jgi:hypothetical protein
MMFCAAVAVALSGLAALTVGEFRGAVIGVGGARAFAFVEAAGVSGL